MTSLKQLEKDIEEIKSRNERVEADKAWETSWARRLIITGLTYILIVIFFYMASLPKPWVNSIVPAVAFMLSTMTMPVFKKLWLRKR